MPKPNGFPKAERLCSKKIIDRLFSPAGHSLAAFPLRAVWMELETEEVAMQSAQVQILVSVSKRKLRHAVDRNLAKRLVREAYRLNKHLLLSRLTDKQLAIAFLWLPGDTQNFKVVQAKMQNLLLRIADNVHHVQLTMDN